MNNIRQYLPTRKINELPKYTYYLIYKFKRIHTRYGKTLLVYLYDYEYNERFKVFLPQRFSNEIPDDDSDSDDDEKDFPKSIGFLTYFEIAFTGETDLGSNRKRYEVDFKRSDNPHLADWIA